MNSLSDEIKSKVYEVIIKEKYEIFKEESQTLQKNRDILKRIQCIDEIDLDIQIKIREDDAITYFDLLDKYNMRYYVKTIILLFASNNKPILEYNLSKEIQEYLYYSDAIIFDMATIDVQLFQTEEMQILLTWYQLYIDNKNSALEYINSLETYPYNLISIIASLIN